MLIQKFLKQLKDRYLEHKLLNKVLPLYLTAATSKGIWCIYCRVVTCIVWFSLVASYLLAVLALCDGRSVDAVFASLQYCVSNIVEQFC